jgi:hypothetical protein
VLAALAYPNGRTTITTAKLLEAANEVVHNLLDGTMSETAYDTAVVSRLPSERDLSRPAFPASIAWLYANQHADGSWGGRIAIAHDRLVSTLAAVVRLAALPDRPARDAVGRGLIYLRQHPTDWMTCPHETVAFELLVPQLVEDAGRLGLDLPYPAYAGIGDIREEKLRRIPPGVFYEKPTTLVHSLEYLGNQLDGQRVYRLRSENGGFANSPSATAHALTHKFDPSAWSYIRRVMGVSVNGGAPCLYPFEVFEKSWVLYNLGLANINLTAAQSHLQFLAESLLPEGVGLSREFLVPDSDDTAVVLRLLRKAGHEVNLAPLFQFEREDCFSTYQFERNASSGANAHVLEALLPVSGESIGCTDFPVQAQKIVSYLRDCRRDDAYWIDKWHVSPYYATAHVMFAANSYSAELTIPTKRWLLDSQRNDGSWGWLGGTSEETAYALLALLHISRGQDTSTSQAMAKGAAFLSEHFDDTDYPELWIGKGLYTPYGVVRSAVIAALHLYNARER